MKKRINGRKDKNKYLTAEELDCFEGIARKVWDQLNGTGIYLNERVLFMAHFSLFLCCLLALLRRDFCFEE